MPPTNLFANIGVDIAAVIDDTMQTVGVDTATFRKRTVGLRDPAHPTAGTADTFASYTVRAIVSDISPGFLEALGAHGGGYTGVEAGDRKVYVLGASLPRVGGTQIVPEVGDIMVPRDGRAQTVYKVDVDPVGAGFDCSVR